MGFDLRKFISENKLSETSKRLDEANEVERFVKELETEFKRNTDKVAKAVEWFAGSVYGGKLPNNLHRDDVKGTHVQSVINTIRDKDVDDDYANDMIRAFKKHMK